MFSELLCRFTKIQNPKSQNNFIYSTMSQLMDVDNNDVDNPIDAANANRKKNKTTSITIFSARALGTGKKEVSGWQIMFDKAIGEFSAQHESANQNDPILLEPISADVPKSTYTFKTGTAVDAPQLKFKVVGRTPNFGQFFAQHCPDKKSSKVEKKGNRKKDPHRKAIRDRSSSSLDDEENKIAVSQGGAATTTTTQASLASTYISTQDELSRRSEEYVPTQGSELLNKLQAQQKVLAGSKNKAKSSLDDSESSEEYVPTQGSELLTKFQAQQKALKSSRKNSRPAQFQSPDDDVNNAELGGLSTAAFDEILTAFIRYVNDYRSGTGSDERKLRFTRALGDELCKKRVQKEFVFLGVTMFGGRTRQPLRVTMDLLLTETIGRKLWNDIKAPRELEMPPLDWTVLKEPGRIFKDQAFTEDLKLTVDAEQIRWCLG